jgi:hypothetical protein
MYYFKEVLHQKPFCCKMPLTWICGVSLWELSSDCPDSVVLSSFFWPPSPPSAVPVPAPVNILATIVSRGKHGPENKAVKKNGILFSPSRSFLSRCG